MFAAFRHRAPAAYSPLATPVSRALATVVPTPAAVPAATLGAVVGDNEPRFLDMVKLNFDRARSVARVDKDLFEVIKSCNSMLRVNFPLRRDNGTIEVGFGQVSPVGDAHGHVEPLSFLRPPQIISGYRAQHKHHRLPVKGGIRYADEVDLQVRGKRRGFVGCDRWAAPVPFLRRAPVAPSVSTFLRWICVTVGLCYVVLCPGQRSDVCSGTHSTSFSLFA